MNQGLLEQPATAIGFARSVVWAFGASGLSAILAVSSVLPRQSLNLSIGVTCAAVLYPLVLKCSSRHAGRAAFLSLLLLGPFLELTSRPWCALLVSAVVTGTLRSWRGWNGGAKLQLWRELCCASTSIVLGSTMFASNSTGVVFGVWGFCFGQLTATLFGDAAEA